MPRTPTRTERFHRPDNSPLPIYTVEALTSFGANFLVTGIYFYTQHRLGWSLVANLTLAAAQGMVYVLGAILAGPLAHRTGRRRGLSGIYLLLMLVSAAGLTVRSSTWLILPLLIYTFVAAMSWPMLESLTSAGLDADRLSRRVGIYNLVWAGTGTLAIAVEGALIEYWPGGIFIMPALCHLVSTLVMWYGVATPVPSAFDTPPLPVEPALLEQRTRALWLSRISLPATYVIVYGLMAMMPSLPVLRTLSTTLQTLIGSIWMAGRLVIFALMMVMGFWHTRPRLLLAAVTIMGIAFFGVTVRISPLLGTPNAAIDLTSMILWQCVLGAVIGIIYYASLYFGMVLSEGSTEHGGYHEALIGLGSVLGPGLAALAAVWWPGRLNASLSAIGIVIGVSVVSAGVIAIRRL